MEDFLKTLKAQLYDRMSSPLLVAFLVSWCVWNWRIFLIWVGSAELPMKLALVDAYFPDLATTIVRGLVAPASTTYLYIYWYPKISHPVFDYVEGKRVELEKLRLKHEGDTPLKQEAARELRQALSVATVKFDQEISRKDGQIQALGIQVSSLEKALDEANNKASSVSVANQPLTVDRTEMATTTNPPLPTVPLEQVPKTVLRPKGESLFTRTPSATEETLRQYFQTGRSDLSPEEKVALVVILNNEDSGKAVSASNFGSMHPLLSKAKARYALAELAEKELVKISGDAVALTHFGTGIAIELARGIEEWSKGAGGGQATSRPTDELSGSFNANQMSGELSDEAKVVVAILFQQKDNDEATTIRDLYDYSSELPKAQVQAALHQLSARGLIEQTSQGVSLTAAGVNAALDIVRNPRL